MITRSIQPFVRCKSIATALAIAAASGAVAAADPSGASLTVTFHGTENRSGAVMAALSADPAAYEGKAPPVAEAIMPVTGDTVTTTFTGLAPGTYAIRAFHDLDGDGKLGVNAFGVPTEPFAFSNDARGAMGPAKWSAAAFEVKAGSNAQSIEIK